MKTVFYTTLVCLLAGLFSCHNRATESNNLKSINSTISIDEFEKKLSERNIQLIDVRTPGEFNQGHIKGALNYDVNSDEFANQISKLDKNQIVLVYCLSGGRSASAAEILESYDFREIYNMQGGIMKWSAANKPLDAGTTSSASNGLSVEDFNELLETEKLVLIDYNAKWCQPCLKMAPMLKAFVEKRKDSIILIKIDADENKNLLRKKGVESIPVLELYKNGKRIWKHDGEIDEATLAKIVATDLNTRLKDSAG